MNDKYLTITALTRYLKHKFEQDPNLMQVYIKGEISNFKAHTTGHYYFSLKDDNSKINAIMFKTNASKLNFVPKEGMKVLVTGSNGFIGKNLISHLQEVEDVEVIKFDRDDDFSVIKENIKDIDMIFHLAGINRPIDKKEFYEGNFDLTKELVDIINTENPDVRFMYSSSIQAELDNDYGKSKLMAEKYIQENIKNNYVFRFHNVFGKWCRPNYNSVVATFCYNVAHDLEIRVDDENKELELIYIDDICYTLLDLLNHNEENIENNNNIYYINPRYKVTLGYIVELINEFKNDMNSIYVPSTGDDFTKKLFATYVSYLDLDKDVTSTVKHEDERGSFTELVRTLKSGQFSISTSKPGVIRGNHYHHTKMERFIVVKGKAKITFESVIDETRKEFYVDDTDIKIVTIPVGYTHNIENIGDDEMVLVMWCNELFDEKKPDTYRKLIKK